MALVCPSSRLLYTPWLSPSPSNRANSTGASSSVSILLRIRRARATAHRPKASPEVTLWPRQRISQSTKKASTEHRSTTCPTRKHRLTRSCIPSTRTHWSTSGAGLRSQLSTSWWMYWRRSCCGRCRCTGTTSSQEVSSAGGLVWLSCGILRRWARLSCIRFGMGGMLLRRRWGGWGGRFWGGRESKWVCQNQRAAFVCRTFVWRGGARDY